MIDIVQDFCDHIENHFFDNVGKITISVGAFYTQKDATLDTIVISLEKALKKAKDNGRNQVSI